MEILRMLIVNEIILGALKIQRKYIKMIIENKKLFVNKF